MTARSQNAGMLAFRIRARSRSRGRRSSSGLLVDVGFLAYDISRGLHLADTSASYVGVTGLFLMIAGFIAFTFTLLLHATAVVVWRR